MFREHVKSEVRGNGVTEAKQRGDVYDGGIRGMSGSTKISRAYHRLRIELDCDPGVIYRSSEAGDLEDIIRRVSRIHSGRIISISCMLDEVSVPF